nr:hypothetical protein CFP56_52161 [Quercus suber]
MLINELPYEILIDILLRAADANEAEGERFTYGLSEAPISPLQRTRLSRYVRGPLTTESLRWDATCSIRQVCQVWHSWALSYNLEHVLERKWRGAERWANLSLRRPSYPLYELIDNPSGQHVYRDPFGTLKRTAKFFASSPCITGHVRRLWFDGFHTAETDRLILSVIASCNELTILSVPWTILRRGTADNWVNVLNNNTGVGKPLHSLELQAVSLPHDQALELAQDTSPSPLADLKVNFSALKRLKIFGNTQNKPITDHDLVAIARTATALECLDITNTSTVSVAGMLALVKASRRTLQVLEHSPRSGDGFFHPFPGRLEPDYHMCTLVASLPRMRDLSLSVPTLCADFFAPAHELQWTGECQVRFAGLCGCFASSSRSSLVTSANCLRAVFAAARTLIATRRRMRHPLAIEIFFAGRIFEPEKRLVHGDFTIPESHVVLSGLARQGDRDRVPSTKGPYGNSGVYEKEEGGGWEVLDEEVYLVALEQGWIEMR